jgi:exopolysaccharide production protein ExoY
MSIQLNSSSAASANVAELDLKRASDCAAAALSILFLLPLLIAVCVLVLIIQGRPIVYSHPRIGKDGRRFGCLKFRTMVRDADRVLQDHLRRNPEAALEWSQNRKLGDDPRVTILGSFLRQSSLDELPQLINILRGEMSFVGPRPIVAEELQKYGEWTSAYLSVRPGLTGLWQISGRSDCSYEERIAFDVSYIRNRNFRGDLAIILRTIPAVLSRKGSV